MQSLLDALSSFSPGFQFTDVTNIIHFSNTSLYVLMTTLLCVPYSIIIQSRTSSRQQPLSSSRASISFVISWPSYWWWWWSIPTKNWFHTNNLVTNTYLWIMNNIYKRNLRWHYHPWYSNSLWVHPQGWTRPYWAHPWCTHGHNGTHGYILCIPSRASSWIVFQDP